MLDVLSSEGVPNLDDATDEDLDSWSRFFDRAEAESFSAALGLPVEEGGRVLEVLRQYARYALEARRSRRVGNLTRAIRIESENDLRYRTLPEALRW